MGFTVQPGAAAQPGPTAAAEHSRFVQRIRRRYAAEQPLLPSGLPLRDTLEAQAHTPLAQRRPLPPALPAARQLALERLAVLEVEQSAEMADIARAMTELAEVTLDRALAAARTEQDERYGPPVNEAGERIDFWVVGMGKLGGRELNVSSDIDLVYVYEEEGHTTGRPDGGGKVSAHEYFSQVARSLY